MTEFIDGFPLIFIDGVQQWISMDFQFFEIQIFENTMKNHAKTMKTMKNQGMQPPHVLIN